MKRVMTIFTVLMMAFVLYSFALAKEEKKEETPDATLKLTQGQVGLGIGWSWGEGVLTYQGVDHKVKVKGLSVIDVGVTKAQAVGTVYHLKNLEDFDGTYTSGAAEGTLGGGKGTKKMQNQHGVVIKLQSTTKGLNFKLAPEGVTLTVEK